MKDNGNQGLITAIGIILAVSLTLCWLVYATFSRT